MMVGIIILIQKMGYSEGSRHGLGLKPISRTFYIFVNCTIISICKYILWLFVLSSKDYSCCCFFSFENGWKLIPQDPFFC